MASSNHGASNVLRSPNLCIVIRITARVGWARIRVGFVSGHRFSDAASRLHNISPLRAVASDGVCTPPPSDAPEPQSPLLLLGPSMHPMSIRRKAVSLVVRPGIACNQDFWGVFGDFSGRTRVDPSGIWNEPQLIPGNSREDGRITESTYAIENTVLESTFV
jgi:hypothetical protein